MKSLEFEHLFYRCFSCKDYGRSCFNIMKPHILFLQKSISTYYNNRLTKQQTKNHEFRPLFFSLILMQRLNSVRFYYIISYFVPAV